MFIQARCIRKVAAPKQDSLGKKRYVKNTSPEPTKLAALKARLAG